MICIICGKNAVLDNLCRECFLDNYTNVKDFKEFTFNVCPTCGAFSYNKAWQKPMPFEEAVKFSINKNIKLEKKPESFKIEYALPEHEQKKGIKIKTEVLVFMKTKVSKFVKEEELLFPLCIKYSLCPKCSREHTVYFEGELQLRNNKSKYFNDAVKFVLEFVDANRSRGVFITKEKEEKEGIDFSFTSQRALQKLGNALAKRFNGELKVSPRLFTRNRQTSKDVYRVNVFFRLADFEKGDIIRAGNTFVKITSFAGKKIKGIDLKQHKIISVPNENYELAAKKDDVCQTHVSRLKPFLEVMHPITYENVAVENPKKVFGNVSIAIIDCKIWLVD